MSSGKLLGSGFIIASIIIIFVYGWLVFFTKYSMLVLKATAFLAVLFVFCMIAWVGYTIATTPVTKQEY